MTTVVQAKAYPGKGPLKRRGGSGRALAQALDLIPRKDFKKERAQEFGIMTRIYNLQHWRD